MSDYEVAPWGVTCYVCGLLWWNAGNTVLFLPGCSVCRVARKHHRALSARQREEWEALRIAAYKDTVAALALADWLEEHMR